MSATASITEPIRFHGLRSDGHVSNAPCSHAILGIDVSKATLDLYLILQASAYTPLDPRAFTKQVPNTAAGFRQLVAWLERKQAALSTSAPLPVHVCLEPTSVYHEPVMEHLSEAGYWVCVVNAGRIRRFAQAIGLDQKTDRLDAKVIAEYAHARHPAASRPLTTSERELRELTRRRTTLVSELGKEQLRLDTTRSALVRRSIQKVIRLLQRELEVMDTAIRQTIQADETLRIRSEHYCSITGVGAVTSATVLAEMPHLADFDSARHAVSFTGLAPRRWQSGSSIDRYGGITKRGNGRVRAVLYMAALVASKNDPQFKAFAQRLLDRGKKKKVVIVAVMRKLLHVLYGIAKSGEPRRLMATA